MGEVPSRQLISRQLVLYDAATRWHGPPFWRGPEAVIEAATGCLVDGIDTPSLRLLAGASANDPTAELLSLVQATLAELGLPGPDAMPARKPIVPDGRPITRLPNDTVRFEVSTAGTAFGGEVLIYVNGEEITQLGAGMGMDPGHLLTPENRLQASTVPRRVSIARCDCGESVCDSTEVVISRDGGAVHWDWESAAPNRGGLTFRAEEYDAEVARIGADRSWEHPAPQPTKQHRWWSGR